MQVCTSLQTENHASTPPLSFLQAGCPSCRPTNSIKALKAQCRQLTDRDFDAIVLSEGWNYDLEFYSNIFEKSYFSLCSG